MANEDEIKLLDRKAVEELFDQWLGEFYLQ